MSNNKDLTAEKDLTVEKDLTAEECEELNKYGIPTFTNHINSKIKKVHDVSNMKVGEIIPGYIPIPNNKNSLPMNVYYRTHMKS